jgi:KDO2-lipid IV(A) lauroyltransferase
MANRRDIGNDSFTLIGYKLASMLARYTPAPLASGAAMALAPTFSLGMRDDRKMVERHLRKVDPTLTDFALRQAVQRAFQSYARYYLETFRLPALSARTINAGFSIEGFSHLEQALQDGKGAILALPHVGGWEWAGRWLCDQGYALTAVVEKLEPPDLYEWFVDMRTKMGVHVIPLDDRAGIAVQEALKMNRPVSLLCDRDIPREGVRSGVEVEFFGERTTVPAGPAFFALRTGAPLIPAAAYFTRRTDGHHTVVRPPLVVERQGSLRDDVARITQTLITEMEVLIRRAPEQWHLFQPNWPSDPGY